jgi:hypothetical protein
MEGIEDRRGKGRLSPVAGVALLAATPGAVVGILLGIQFLQPADSAGRLLMFGGCGATVGGFGAYLAVYAVKWFFGDRVVSVVGAAISGGMIGLIAGLRLTETWDAGWPLLLCPLGAAIAGWRARRQLLARESRAEPLAEARDA